MRATLVVVLSVMVASGLCSTVVAGSVDSPGAPSSGSGMYSLSQIYNYLNSGIKTTPVPSFQEPVAAPGPTMKTTKEIYDDIMAKFDQSAATTAEDVKSGKPFFCTQPGSWGVQTGTLVIPPTPTITPTVTPTPTISPIPTPDENLWYATYGPSGSGDVAKSGTLCVALKHSEAGCAFAGHKTWADACTWIDALTWLGRNDWRMPTMSEYTALCQQSFPGWTTDSNFYTWSFTESGSKAYHLDNISCTSWNLVEKTTLDLLRPVRDVP